jgi:CspA family cold shock protein
MPVGRVKWYDKGKGYGFIDSPEGDVFFHFSDILMEGFKALAEDQRVSYKLLRTPEGLKAKNIQPLDKRSVVRSAARYRTLVLMKVRQGHEEEFDQLMSESLSWLDEFEQDVGLRRIGTWRLEADAVYLVESDKPYGQAMQSAREHPKWASFQKWQESLAKLLDSEPQVMPAVLSVDKPAATDGAAREAAPKDEG